MRDSFLFFFVKLVSSLILTICIALCLTVISEEIREVFNHEKPSYGLEFDYSEPDDIIIIDSLFINTDLQTLTVNENEIHLSTIEYRVIEKICKKIAESSNSDIQLKTNSCGGNN